MNEPQRRFITIGVRAWLTAAAVFFGAYVLWQILAGALTQFLLLFTGILFAAGLRPIVDRLSRRMPFGAAVGVAFGAVLLAVALIAYFTVAPLTDQFQHFLRGLPSQMSALQAYIADVQRAVSRNDVAQKVASSVAGSAGGAAVTIATQLVRGQLLLVTILSNSVVLVLLAIGWILASDQLSAFVVGLLPPNSAQDWRSAFDTIAQRLSAYVQGVVLNGSIVGVVMSAVLALLSIPYALLLGFISGVLQGIPMIGGVIAGVIMLLVVLATSGLTKMLIVLVVFVVVQIVDGNVISPLIFGKGLQLSFLMIIFSTVIGGTVLGIPGAFLAVPAAAVLQTIVTTVVAPAIRRANSSGSA